MNRHGGTTSRTFIVEDYSEDENGQWATDEVTGEQGYIGDERSCFWTWDTTSMSGSPESLRIASWREEEAKEKAKEKANEDSKDKEEHSLVKNKHVILNGSLQKMVLGGPKEDEAKRVDRKVKIASLQSGRRTCRSEKSASSEGIGQRAYCNVFLRG